MNTFRKPFKDLTMCCWTLRELRHGDVDLVPIGYPPQSQLAGCRWCWWGCGHSPHPAPTACAKQQRERQSCWLLERHPVNLKIHPYSAQQPQPYQGECSQPPRLS